MAAAKFNVFHWHIVEDESFPLALNSFPTLSFYGGYQADQIYTREAVKQVIDYAHRYAIRVIPEFDNPGHTRSIGFDPYFKDIVRCFGNTDVYNLTGAYEINGSPDSSSLDPTYDKTYELIQGVYSELNELFPGLYIHLGGDEVDLSCYDENPKI
jgi:hexosaminidase